jgi:catalase
VKPEPHNEIPQASSAHDTLWDFVQLQPETMHMMMWMMSDRALPRSFRMMQGFGVHTFRFVNDAGVGTFVKFHWKPRLGTHSLVWDETQKIAGKDPDFNRRDLWEAIEAGQYPEWELGVQLVPEADQDRFDFDLLDATKIIPEEEVPVLPIGRMVLDRNPDNFFAEVEQVAFHLGNTVPGIDFTDDPLLQARLFSYLDTQLIRLGGPNFPQLPVNRPIAPVHNHQVDGYHQTEITTSRATYHPNSLGGGCPALADDGAYVHYAEHVAGNKIRKRSESFADHFSQATLFWNSMSDWEREHIVAAFRFELGKVEHRHIREGVVTHLNQVDHDLAVMVAEGVGVEPPERPVSENQGRRSPALSQANTAHSPATRKIAILVADGVDADDVEMAWAELRELTVRPEILAPRDGTVSAADGATVKVTRALATVDSVLYDAVLVPGGAGSARALSRDGQAVYFVTEAYKHYKAVGALGDGVELLLAARVPCEDRHGHHEGVVVGDRSDGVFIKEFADAVATHRHYDRETAAVPA